MRLEGGSTLRLRELSTERRAGAHLLDADALAAHEPLLRLGPEPLGLDSAGWRAALGARPGRLHTALREGRRVAGIGRAYASEIMWAARLAPFAPVQRLPDEAWARLAAGAEAVLTQALARARAAIDVELPTRERRVTAVHAHHGEPCLRCATRLERVSFEGYELVYCPGLPDRREGLRGPAHEPLPALSRPSPAQRYSPKSRMRRIWAVHTWAQPIRGSSL